MNRVYLIRHAATAGNLERRYTGVTDEPLCALGRQQAKALAGTLPEPDALFVSPLRRAAETAALLFPARKPVQVPELRETDFGDFEGLTGAELWERDPRYRLWVDGGCKGPIPGGEHPREAAKRVRDAFLRSMADVPEGKSAAFVLHGGGIMAICAALAVPARDFYAWHTDNAHARAFLWDGNVLRETAPKGPDPSQNR